MSQLNIFINILILLALGVGLPSLVVTFLSLFKIKINKTGQMYLYSFAAGLILILGTVGFLGEALEHSREHFETMDALSILQVVGLVGGGAIIGIFGVFLLRWLITRSKYELHEHHHFHDHNDEIFNARDIDNKKVKWLPILLLIGHRCVDGITLGFMANTASTGNVGIAEFDNWGMIITFAVHLIPTSIIIYLMQLDIQNNRRFKALMVTIGMALLMVPFTFLGGFLIANVQQTVWWLMPLLFAISGSIMTLMSIIELIPEFIHFRNSQRKQWITSIVLLSLGIILAIILICVHTD